MYEIVWDEIINKREIDKINETNFDKNITLITAPENVVGMEGFKDYYQNYLTGEYLDRITKLSQKSIK